MTPAERVAQEERRHARDSWRRTGGSARRPLHSFATADEKRARRLEHVDRINAAVSALRTDTGWADWVASLELNPDVSALNAALLAEQVPGEIAGTAAFWKRNGYMIRKGERAAAFITGPMFYPRGAWLADQVGATDLAGMSPAGIPADVEAKGRELLELQLREGAKSRIACELAAVRMGLRDRTD
jgi:hypothetical protein